VASPEVTLPDPSSPAPWVEGVHDLSLMDLDEASRVWLDDGRGGRAQPFLNSLAFAMWYDHPPATRVRVVVQANQPARVGFYREARSLAMFRVIEFVGFPTLIQDDLEELLRDRKAQAATLFRLESPGQDVGLERGGTPITHNVIAELPNDPGKYLASLGKQKRQQLPRYWRKLERECDGQVRMEFVPAPHVNIGEINQLVAFNQQRMGALGKGNSTAQESRKQRRREPLTQRRGLLCKLLVREALVGGTFNYVHGDEAFLIVIAHDTAWERHNVGHLALWRTIEHCIGLGVRRYHLFWGRKRYKNEFGGVDHVVSELVIARHRWLLPLWKFRRGLKLNGPRAMSWLKRKLRPMPVTIAGGED
jgi:hypothetical protein